MTQIDFYILSASQLEARIAFAARLCEKIASARHPLVVAHPSEADCQQFSQQLWHLRPDAFVPHHIANDSDTNAQRAPIWLCQKQPPPHAHDVLINLSGSLLEHCFSRFNRVVEIVVQDTSILEQTRDAYQFYNARKYPIRTHKLTV